jgi:hypothetical protein
LRFLNPAFYGFWLFIRVAYGLRLNRLTRDSAKTKKGGKHEEKKNPYSSCTIREHRLRDKFTSRANHSRWIHRSNKPEWADRSYAA